MGEECRNGAAQRGFKERISGEFGGSLAGKLSVTRHKAYDE